MSNKSISQLSAGVAVAATDLFPDVQSVGNGPVKVTALQIGTYVMTGVYDPGFTYNTTAKSLTLGVASTTSGSIVLNNGTNANTVTIQPGASSASVAYTLPTAAPAGNGYVLTAATTGVMSWSDPTVIGIDLNVGSTVIVSGMSGGILWNNAGVLGNATALSTNGTASMTFGVQQTTQGSIVLANTAAGAYPTTIQSSNTATEAWTLTLPTTNGSNGQALITDGNGVTSWGPAGATISDDTSTNATEYPLFSSVTTGAPSTVYVSSTKFTFNPSTGNLLATAVGASNGIFINATTVSADYTIPTNYNGGSFGPVTVNSGITVTVSAGSVWTII